MENKTVVSEIKKTQTSSDITISNLVAGKYQKEGTISAELRQVVTTVTQYPAKRIMNSLQDNIFSIEDFNFEASEPFTNKETRVTWIDVPVGTTMEQVLAKLAAAPNANLYRVLDNQPIVSDSDQAAIANAETEVDLNVIANRQAVRFPKGHLQEGALALDSNGKVQYRRIAFSVQGKEDLDLRQANMDYGYMSPELKDEVNGGASTVIKGQTL